MHAQRIKEELKAVGVTRYGLRKFAIRYLPKIIHADESIKAAIYGRYSDETGNLNLNAGALVATNKRIIFLDHKPGYTRTDDIDYSVVSGIKETTAIFSAVTLYTPGDKNYQLRFLNPKCSSAFVQYIEGQGILKKV